MKILVIQQKMIGDVLTSSILFEALRHKYPEAQLDYLINEHTCAVVENNPFINNIIFFTKKEEISKSALFKFAQRTSKINYDVIIDVYSKFSSNLITVCSLAKTKISKHKWYTSFLYTHTFKESKEKKTNAGLAIENRLEFLQPLGIESNIIKPKIYLTPQEIESSKVFLLENGISFSKSLFMVSVLGSSDNKTYPLENMAKLIDAIAMESNGQILFNYIPNQLEKAKIVYNLCNSETQRQIYFNVFGKNLRQFLSITKHCTALIGNEGGAVNMAKALNIPTYTIFSPWILKDAWNMFEDGKNHVSIHLQDVKPDLFKEKSLKSIKKDAILYYNQFTLNLILPHLRRYLKRLNS